MSQIKIIIAISKLLTWLFQTFLPTQEYMYPKALLPIAPCLPPFYKGRYIKVASPTILSIVVKKYGISEGLIFAFQPTG